MSGVKVRSDETLKATFDSHFSALIAHLYSSKEPVVQACNYALNGPGKRIRPLLVLEVHRIFSADCFKALPAACALEMIHTYSLVHDDLPSMDNDDLRRGRATVHKAFDEPTALLVGDALLTDAFYVLTSAELVKLWRPSYEAPIRLSQMVAELAKAAGGLGMVLGQNLDLQYTGKNIQDEAILEHIYHLKTGKLITAACILGALSADASEADVEQMRRLGSLIGLAFQIKDDLLDNEEGTGKTKGKDLKQGKSTFVQLLGYEKALSKSKNLMEEAKSVLARYSENATSLLEFVDVLIDRKF